MICALREHFFTSYILLSSRQGRWILRLVMPPDDWRYVCSALSLLYYHSARSLLMWPIIDFHIYLAKAYMFSPYCSYDYLRNASQPRSALLPHAYSSIQQPPSADREYGLAMAHTSPLRNYCKAESAASRAVGLGQAYNSAQPGFLDESYYLVESWWWQLISWYCLWIIIFRMAAWEHWAGRVSTYGEMILLIYIDVSTLISSFISVHFHAAWHNY